METMAEVCLVDIFVFRPFLPNHVTIRKVCRRWAASANSNLYWAQRCSYPGTPFCRTLSVGSPGGRFMQASPFFGFVHHFLRASNRCALCGRRGEETTKAEFTSEDFILCVECLSRYFVRVLYSKESKESTREKKELRIRKSRYIAKALIPPTPVPPNGDPLRLLTWYK